MYDTIDELLAEIRAGEDSLLDFKEVNFSGSRVFFKHDKGSDDAREIAKDLSCFANADGGVIVYGVRKDGEPAGIPDEGVAKLQELILNAAQNNVTPPLGHLLKFDRLLLPDSQGKKRLCLKLEIKRASNGVHAPNGELPYRRMGDRCEAMSIDQVACLLERRRGMAAFEELPVPSAPSEAIDAGLFEDYCLRHFGEPLSASELPRNELLLNLKFLAADEAGMLHPTCVGLLCLCRQPDLYLGGAYVDLALFEGEELDPDRQIDRKPIRGPLLQQIEQVTDYLKLHVVMTSARKTGRGRVDHPAYSLRGLQEAVVNAVVHRDYSILGSQVRVYAFDDRVEITNPGRLHNTLTPENLFAGCHPVRRNQMLAAYLFENENPITGRRYMELSGAGFRLLLRECSRLGAPGPRLEIVGDSVKLTIYRSPLG